MSAWDVVVVGAGSAGSVIANRASEDPDRTVLLLEAGPDYPRLDALPWDLVNGHENSYVDHDWRLGYQPTVAGGDQPFPRGRVTGGSSAVNTAIALRGVPEDYDGWAERGNPEWAWTKVLPAFRRLERDLDFGHAPHHGDAGPTPVRRYPATEMGALHLAFLEAAAAAGYPMCPDANHPTDWGAGPQPMNKLGRLRVSTAIGYLAPARARPNLTVRGDTSTVRVRVEGGRAVGVEVAGPGGPERLDARLVVLCAGAVHSPGLLVRSGVGPAGELDRLGVERVADVPAVGANLADHPALALVCEPADPALVDRDGPLIQTILRSTGPGSDARMDLQIELLSFVGPPDGPPLFAVAAVLEQTDSRGEVRQRSADPAAKPAIEPRLCADDRDARRLAACFREAQRLVATEPLASLVGRVRFPDPDRPLDDETLDALLRRRSGSGFHPVGTVRMGPAEDPMAVVDQYGRCHAVDGLVVADASIMPTVPRANTNLTSIMIGEMVGEWLRTRPGRYGL